MFDHSRMLSQEYYQVNKVGNLMSLYTNDLDTIQECFGDGVLMFFDALLLGLLAIIKMWRMDHLLTLLSLIPMAFLLVVGSGLGKVMVKNGRSGSRLSLISLILPRRVIPASPSSRPL